VQQPFDGHNPSVEPTAWVHEAAILIGEVEVRARASIWPTAVLRGDMGVVRIGEDTNIQDGTICHNTSGISETHVGARCTVGHRVVLHGCVVEDDCLIGMGAILMDNVRIGAGSLVAAGTLIPPNKVIPPGSLVMGSPGRVLRSVGQRERQMIDNGWRSYAKKLAIWNVE
jgi:carbonic anhydrase/acetyltransferase-like protein (isoleucine patch superfamily)